MISTFLLVISIAVTSCNQCDSIDFINFDESSDHPFIYISKELNDCVYQAKTALSFNDTEGIERALIRRSIDSYLISIDSSKYDVIFDFTAEIGESRVVSFNQIGREVLLRNVHKVHDLFVYEFILKGSYFYEEISYDITFFVTQNQFIHGCYLLGKDSDGTEMVIAEQGEIFRDYIDYSNKRFGTLE